MDIGEIRARHLRFLWRRRYQLSRQLKRLNLSGVLPADFGNLTNLQELGSSRRKHTWFCGLNQYLSLP
nr:hypothetical protein CFP56_29460 [Quercus suber]